MEQAKNILFLPTFGAGLGHLTRELAIATQIRAKQPERQLIFFTTSPASQYLYQNGFYFYYIPDPRQATVYMTYQQWEHIFYEQLIAIIRLHQIQILVLDGGSPYIGLRKARVLFRNMVFIWVKREGDKKIYKNYRQQEELFDQLIIPGEFGGNNREQTEHCLVTNPVIYECKQKMAVWDVHKTDHRYWYVQLGAGIINEVKGQLQEVIRILLQNEKNEVIIANSPVGIDDNNGWRQEERVHYLKDYPNVKYFQEIDYAVCAAGYNSYHELLYYKVPTLFLPNAYTDKDDQIARAKNAERLGIAYCAVTLEEIQEKLTLLQLNRERIRQELNKNLFQNGVQEAAEKIMTF